MNHPPYTPHRRGLLHILRGLLLACALVVAPGCGLFPGLRAQGPEAIAATAVAIGANALLDTISKAYSDDLIAAIRTAAIAEDKAADTDHRPPDRQKAMSLARAAVERRWLPIWGSASVAGLWERFRAAHDAWAEAIERGEHVELQEVMDPLVAGEACELLTALAELHVAAEIGGLRCP